MSTVLGVKMVGHDTGAAICADGRVFAIAEERLNRVKHSFNTFPRRAIAYCLEAARVAPAAVDLVVIDRVGLRHDKTLKETFAVETAGAFANARLETVNHHDAHAASAFFASGFSEAAVLVFDGSGERMLTHLGVYGTETETLYRGVGRRLDVIQKTVHARTRHHFHFTFGIGKLYSLLSNDYLGFGRYNQGKMMGLAPYGDMSLFDLIPEERWFKEVDGHVVCNPHILFPHRAGETIREKCAALWSSFSERVTNMLRSSKQSAARYLSGGLLRKPPFFAPIRLPQPPRTSRDDLPDKYYASVARAGQHIMERVAFLWGRRLRALVDSHDLCVAGGLGLNIDANRNFIERVGFQRLFVQPGASDTGVALGCALWGRHMILGEERVFTMTHAFLGRTYDNRQIRDALEKRRTSIEFVQKDDVAADAAKLLRDGQIGAWFEGGSEYGPRALGHRSIIADARRADAKDVLNKRVKHREPWRPFGCSILQERLRDYFDLSIDSPFMLLAAKARPGIRELIPSVVHVDNTSRIQTVTKEQNGRFFELITHFGRLTGVPVILNTSFNVAGDPIVETPEDALDTFLRTDLDFLVMEDVLVRRRPNGRGITPIT